jgi:beta-N-acetylhexosaminidase
MTSELDWRAAQLLTVGFQGRALGDDLKKLLDRGVSGVVLFARNIEAPEQVAALIGDIKRYAARPLFVALDQEGGLVARLRKGFTRLPPMRAVGSLDDVALAERVGRLLGRELRAVGVDVNFAPVIDVDTNPGNPVIGSRSLSRDAATVARLGVALGRGIESEGVASCGKHFPGHGDTAQDSHLELPRLPHAIERLDAVELVPFRAWAEAGLASVMTAHVIFEPIDTAYPATMSRPVLQDLLRARLGYEGLVFSDDLEMKAIADHYGYEDAVVFGVLAGVDNFLCCHTAALAHRIVDALTEAVRAGRVPAQRLDDAYRRVDTFVRRWARPAEPPRLEVLASDEHLDCVREIYERVATGLAEMRLTETGLGEIGEDPTEIMDRMLRERVHQKNVQT